MSDALEALMRQALDEGRKGWPSPNPHVGALIVDAAGAPIARGHCARAGGDHAEIMALKAAGERARGATMVVTLEPHNHHGKTPPCTEAIIAAGIARVVVGCRDPNPKVNGSGVARLRAAGIEVVEDVLACECGAMVAPFAKHIATELPFVRLKLATSLDGRIATASGASRWITGPEARVRVHALRRTVDAVAVGIGTALADAPTLTPRDAPPVEGRTPPVRVVFDRRARLPLDAPLVATARETATWLVTGPEADTRAHEAAGVHVLRANEQGGALDLGAALAALGKRGIVDLLVEGGAVLAGAMLASDAVDELWWFVAPLVLGDQGRAAVIGPAPATPDDAQRFSVLTRERYGDDTLIVMRRRAVDRASDGR
jgi:diaminohydroxyphosphoribosylaminopyrimidine deaminase/5-amino-6-(5-phosphoribosylamino)uracil reductase